MGNVDYKYIECRALARPISAYRPDWIDSLSFRVENAPLFVQAARDAAQKTFEDLSNAAAQVRRAPMALTAARDKRSAELNAAQDRLAVLEGQPAILKQKIATALARGDGEAAEDDEAELPSAQLAIEAARNRVVVLRGLLEEESAKVAIEQREAITNIFSRRRGNCKPPWRAPSGPWARLSPRRSPLWLSRKRRWPRHNLDGRHSPESPCAGTFAGVHPVCLEKKE